MNASSQIGDVVPMICPLLQDECLEDECAWFIEGECAISIIASSLSEDQDIFKQEAVLQKMKEKW